MRKWHARGRSANQFDYVDGASSAVLRHPYTIAHAQMVRSCCKLHLEPRRETPMAGRETCVVAKIFVKGRELDGRVGMALDDGTPVCGAAHQRRGTAYELD